MAPQLPNEVIDKILNLVAMATYQDLEFARSTQPEKVVNIAMISVASFKQVLKIVTFEQAILARVVREEKSISRDVWKHRYRWLSCEHARVYDVKEAMAKAVHGRIPRQAWDLDA